MVNQTDTTVQPELIPSLTMGDLPLETRTTLLKTVAAKLIYHTTMLAVSQGSGIRGCHNAYSDFGLSRNKASRRETHGHAQRRMLFGSSVYRKLQHSMPAMRQTEVPNLSQLSVYDSHPCMVRIQRKEKVRLAKEFASAELYFPRLDDQGNVRYTSLDGLFKENQGSQYSLLTEISLLVENDVSTRSFHADVEYGIQQRLKTQHDVDISLIKGELSDLLDDSQMLLGYLTTHYSHTA